jgi:hypothetical protein
MSDTADAASTWATDVTDLATQHAYLLHNLLALSALHLRSTCPEQAERLERIASEHQTQGIPLFREAVARDLDKTPLPLFVCACMVVPMHFAASKDPLSLILNEEKHRAPDWLHLIDGANTITLDHLNAIKATSLRSLLGPMPPLNLEDIDDSPVDRELIILKDIIPIETDRTDDYRHLIDILRFFFTLSNRGPNSFDHKNAAIRFPIHFIKTAKDDLARRYPAALILMAFWLVLLFRIEDRWWLKGKVEPMALKIHQLLPIEHRHLIDWPLAQMCLSLQRCEGLVIGCSCETR